MWKEKNTEILAHSILQNCLNSEQVAGEYLKLKVQVLLQILD